MKYKFKQEEKEKVLQGRTITYLANNMVHVSKEYLINILNGKIHCSKIIANRIIECINENAKLEDYFEIID